MTGNAIRQHVMLDALEPQLCVTVEYFVRMTPLSRRAVSQAATNLISRGLLERVERGCFQLTRQGVEFKASGQKLTSGPNKPTTGIYKRCPKSLRSRIWKAIATMDKFTVRDLVGLAATGEEKDAMNNATRFVRDLCRAGYLRRLGVREATAAPTSNGLLRFSKLRHTGPIAPTKRKHGMFDHNLEELFLWIG